MDHQQHGGVQRNRAIPYPHFPEGLLAIRTHGVFRKRLSDILRVAQRHRRGSGALSETMSLWPTMPRTALILETAAACAGYAESHPWNVAPKMERQRRVLNSRASSTAERGGYKEQFRKKVQRLTSRPRAASRPSVASSARTARSPIEASRTRWRRTARDTLLVENEVRLNEAVARFVEHLTVIPTSTARAGWRRGSTAMAALLWASWWEVPQGPGDGSSHLP